MISFLANSEGQPPKGCFLQGLVGNACAMLTTQPAINLANNITKLAAFYIKMSILMMQWLGC